MTNLLILISLLFFELIALEFKMKSTYFTIIDNKLNGFSSYIKIPVSLDITRLEQNKVGRSLRHN